MARKRTEGIARVAKLLAAARSPDDAAPRALYCAEARQAYDAARAELEALGINLRTLEVELLKGGDP